MRGLLVEDRGRALESTSDQATADQLPGKPEAQLEPGEQRERDAHDRCPVVLGAYPVLREGDHLLSILVRCVDVDDRVLGAVIGPESVPPHAGPERFDDRAVRRDDERAVIPVRVGTVLADETQALPEMDDPAPELAAVRENEVAGQWVGVGLTRRDVVESSLHHRRLLCRGGHAATASTVDPKHCWSAWK